MAETSPHTAMNFKGSVKVTVLVQILVCFVIITSSVFITRSVVLSNVAKLNANSGHISGPSAQLKSNSTSTVNDTVIPNSTSPVNDTAISNSTSLVNDTAISNSASPVNDRDISNPTSIANDTVTAPRIELDYTKLHGYIVSNNERRYYSSKVVLEKLGLVPHQHVPLSYKSDAIRKAMEKFHIPNRYLSDRYKKVFSNRMAFRSLFQQFVDDRQAAMTSWRFFFEDDITLHPSLTNALAQKVLAQGLEVAAGDGIVYLGVCGPNSCERKIVLTPSPRLEATKCAGACTHALGLTKWKTVDLLAYMDKVNNFNVSGPYFDMLMRRYGQKVHRIWVLGSNLVSPQVGNHVGLVFQDRRHYPSVIDNAEPKQ